MDHSQNSGEDIAAQILQEENARKMFNRMRNLCSVKFEGVLDKGAILISSIFLQFLN